MANTNFLTTLVTLMSSTFKDKDMIRAVSIVTGEIHTVMLEDPTLTSQQALDIVKRNGLRRPSQVEE